MKSARVFLAGMYLHLVLSIGTPIGILSFSDSWDSFSVGILCLYLAMIAAVQVSGWVCVAIAVTRYRRQPDVIRRGWKLLKLWSIPFYLINFVYSVFAWFILLAASRGMIFFLLPIPFIITCLMVVQSGCVGICYLMYLRRLPGSGGKPSKIHYLMQLIPIADVVSTGLVLRSSPAVPSEAGQQV